MMNEALLDVNLLIAGAVENHADHERAQRFLQTLQTFHTTPTTQGGFLRFLTRPWKDEQRREQPPRMSIAQAFATLRTVVESPRHSFLPDDEPFTGVSLRSLSGHRQWTDAYLLRLARKHGLRLASLERKMDNMDDSTLPTLFVVS
jgi:toxin-antitoxin system PIN domain toxin